MKYRVEIEVVIDTESEVKAWTDCQRVCDSMLCHDQFKEAWINYVIEIEEE